MMGLAAVVLGWLWHDVGAPMPLAIVLTLLLGVLGGALNAVLITRLKFRSDDGARGRGPRLAVARRRRTHAAGDRAHAAARRARRRAQRGAHHAAQVQIG